MAPTLGLLLIAVGLSSAKHIAVNGGAPAMACGRYNVSSIDPPAPEGGAKCDIPAGWRNQLLVGSGTWSQRLPNGLTWSATGDTEGWSLNPEWLYGCSDGGWCPYVCAPGYVEAQYDNAVGKPWFWTSSCSGDITYIGAGRRVLPPNCGGNGLCAGGQQGGYCNNGTIVAKAPSSALHGAVPCIPGPLKVFLFNNFSRTITVCRQESLGTGIPMCYATLAPNETIVLSAPPPPVGGVPQWYTAGSTDDNVMGLEFYIVDNSSCLTPPCMLNKKRPACVGQGNTKGCDQGIDGEQSKGGKDYYPYILQTAVGVNNQVPYVQVGLLSNNDEATGLQWGTYDRALGAPDYGIKLVYPGSFGFCDAFWDGPRHAAGTCNRVCAGQGCADDKVQPRLFDIQQQQFLPPNTTCSTFINIGAGGNLTFVVYPRP